MSAQRAARAFAAAGFAVAVVLTVSVDVSSAALEIRHSFGAHYDSELTRAYRQCNAPNTTSSGGVPACTPPVTSACDYWIGDVELDPLKNEPSVEVTLHLRDAEGPGNCATGPYTAIFSVRVTADDSGCTSGQCTWVDADIPVTLNPHFIGSIHNFELQDVSLEDVLESYSITAGHVANYEILGVTVQAPDGLPIAAAGVGTHSAGTFRSDATARYTPPCTSPDTTNISGFPACSAPTWGANCDFTLGEIRFRGTSSLQGTGVFIGAGGASPLCSNGTYEIETVVRATGIACGGSPCTLIDTPVVFPIDAVEGAINDSSLSNIVDLSDLLGTVEIRETFLRDPLGEETASPGVTNAFVLDTPVVRVAFRDQMNPTDDKLTLRAKFPHPPLDPSVGGATFTVTDQNGTVYSVTIPAGAWEIKKPGKSWKYKDDTGALAGVRVATIKEYSGGLGFKIRVLVKDVSLSAADLPSVNLAMSVSNADSSTSIGMRNATCRIKPSGRNCRL